jgi:UDP-N-acetylmuramoyl-L-alanyl-D-glutamate--2,6-diaminopimelate ligase
MGVDTDAIRKGIRNLSGVPGRMQWFEAPGGIRIIVDYAHTPAALESVLLAGRTMTERELTVIFGCGGDRDRGKRPEMGKAAAAVADRVIVTSDNPRNEDPASIIEDIVQGIMDKKRVMTILDRRNAIQYAIEEAKTGDTILIAGKGHETYQEIKGKRFPFDDLELAREIVGAGEKG